MVHFLVWQAQLPSLECCSNTMKEPNQLLQILGDAGAAFAFCNTRMHPVRDTRARSVRVWPSTAPFAFGCIPEHARRAGPIGNKVSTARGESARGCGEGA